LSIALLGSCAYFNTFYNAQGCYRDGLKMKAADQQTQAKAKFEKAIEKSALVLKRWPRSRWADDALFLIGMSYYQQGMYAKAVRHFDQLSLAFPGSGLVPEAQLYHGLSLLADKQYGPARVRLEDVRTRHRRLADAASFALARSLLDRDEPDQAIDSLARFYERYPKSTYRREAVKQLADACRSRRRFAEAEQWYARYARVAQEPKERALARLRVAACQLELGRYGEAVEQARDLLGRYPELDDEANLILGNAHEQLARPAEAVGAWGKVRSQNDKGAEASFRIGRYYEEQGEFEKARAYYDTARLRRVDSDYGVLAVKRLSLLDAFTQQKAGKREPAEAAFLLAEVHNLNLGDYDGAMALYQQVYDSFPDTEWAAKGLFTKAWILRNVKHDTAQAEPLLRRVIAEFPETDYADASRAWLGLPVPKREKKKPARDTLRADTAQAGRPVEPPEPDTLAGMTPAEPGLFPHRPGMPGPDRMRERIDEATGTAQLTPREDVSRPRVPDAKPEPERPRPQAPSQKPETSGVKPQVPGPKPEPESTAAAVRRVLAFFGTDSAELTSAGQDSLSGFVEYLKANPRVQVELVGYCDPRGTDEYNYTLGLRRAEAVRRFLLSAGIAETRVSVTSRGEREPRSSGPEEYRLDRRVESRPR
jgi:peptidoglycan-associated lipoprotein